jgi:hypothetical protein
MVNIKQTLTGVGIWLTGTIGTALAAANETFQPDIEAGKSTVMGLEYADKIVMIINALYYILNLAAVAALIILGIKLVMGVIDSVEHEIRSRRALMMVIITILTLKVGLVLISWILGW